MFWKKLKKKAAEKHNYDLTYDNVAIPEVHTHKPEDHEETVTNQHHMISIIYL